jgi:hypothetical protein
MPAPTITTTTIRTSNHTQTLARSTGLKVKTNIEAGLWPPRPS